MTHYLVELTGNVREVYSVEANSPEEAKANWMDGHLETQESGVMTVRRITEDN